MYAKILQRLLQNFFVTMGRAPLTPAEWSKLRRQAMELARKEGGDPITGAKTPTINTKIDPQPKLPFDTSADLPGIASLRTNPNIIPFPKGRRTTPAVKAMMQKGDVQLGKAPRTTEGILKAKKDRGILLRDADEAIVDIKRKNKEAVERFRKKTAESDKQKKYESLVKTEKDKMAADEDYIPDIVDPDEFAGGGIAPLVGEPSYAANFYDDRTPMKEGKKAKKKKKTAAALKKELVEDLIKQGVPVEVIKTVMRKLPRPWERLPHGQQRYYRGEKDLPEGILELLQKDPGFDMEAFKDTYWAGKGWRHTDPGWNEGRRGSYSPMTGAIELNLAPFGEKEYTKFRAKSPHLPDRFLTDTDKAKIALHELRHKNIMEDQNLFKTQPEWVQQQEGPGYLPKGGVTGH